MPRPLLLVPLFLLLAACGSSSSNNNGGGGGGSSSSLGLLLGDAPTDSLSSFTVAVSDLRLRKADNSLSANLLAAPRTLDVLGLGLDAREALLDLVQIPAGTYTGARVSIDPASVAARDLAGNAVTIGVQSATGEASFASTQSGNLVVGSSGFASVSFDIVLDQSLSANGPSAFLFALQLRSGHGNATPLLDDFLGKVRSIDRPARQFVVEILDSRQDDSTFGTLTVEVEDSDQLLQSNGAEFGNANAFLAALQVNDLVEIAGALGIDGVFDALRCEIEDRGGNHVRIEGRVLSVDLPGQTFEFLWEEIEKGFPVAQPVLAALGNPGVLSIAWDAQTQFLGDKGAGPGSPNDLIPGKKVDVRFRPADFQAPMPFRAHSVRVDGGERYEGHISSIAGLPNEFEMILEIDHPARQSGLITGPVTIDLVNNPFLFLDSGVSPLVAPADLLVGLKVKVAGPLDGAGTSAVVAANRIEVEAGRLEGVMESISSSAAEMTVFVQKLKDPFGQTEPSGSALVRIPANAVIELNGSPATLAQLRSAFANLGQGFFLEVEVEGIGDGSGGVNACEIEVEEEEDD